MQKNVFGLLTSRELFRIRAVCSDWSDQVKGIWCQVVKDEMLEQVHSLDLLYEKETTAKLLEFKLKYLVSYATLMNNYFSHMNFTDITNELLQLEDVRAKQLMLIAAMVVGPKETVSGLIDAQYILSLLTKIYLFINRCSLLSLRKSQKSTSLLPENSSLVQLFKKSSRQFVKWIAFPKFLSLR